jgi:hypothetical protein
VNLNVRLGIVGLVYDKCLIILKIMKKIVLD